MGSLAMLYNAAQHSELLRPLSPNTRCTGGSAIGHAMPVTPATSCTHISQEAEQRLGVQHHLRRRAWQQSAAMGGLQPCCRRRLPMHSGDWQLQRNHMLDYALSAWEQSRSASRFMLSGSLSPCSQTAHLNTACILAWPVRQEQVVE